MSRVGGIHGRKVTWSQLIPSHDPKVWMNKTFTGVVIEHTWINGDCVCICAEPDGKLWTKNTRELQLVESPLAATKYQT